MGGSKRKKNHSFFVKYIYNKVLFKGALLDFFQSDNEDNLTVMILIEWTYFYCPAVVPPPPVVNTKSERLSNRNNLK